MEDALIDADQIRLEKQVRMALHNKMFLEGKTEEEIQASLGMDVEQYRAFQKECFENEAGLMSMKSSGEVFIEYVFNQKRCIKDLEMMARRFDRAKHYSSLISSVKARSEIYDKIIRVGQEFGIIEKKPERKEIVAGVMVAKMDDAQLRQAIIDEVNGLEHMMTLAGGKTNLLEVKPTDPVGIVEPVYSIKREEVLVDKKKEKLVTGHKSRSHVVSSGRRLVKKSIADKIK